MKIETIKTPETVKEFKKLLKDKHVFVVFNSYPYIFEMYSKAGRNTNEINYDDCYKIRPLSSWVKDKTNTEQLESYLWSIENHGRCLVRIE